MIENLNDKIKAYALRNAIAHGGRANPGAVVSALFNEGLEKSGVKEVMPKIKEVIKEIENLDLEKQKEDFEKLKEFTSEREVREGLPELPNSENGVIMRIAPSPSGPLHLMHAINLSLNYLYVQKYGGTLYVRIEDTNPENIYPKAYEMIESEAQWLADNKAKIIIQSERMDLYCGYAVALIEKGKAYVCECSGDEFREFAKEKKDCPCRNKPVEQNIKDWEKMFDKDKFKEGEVVLRFKSDMKHKNPAMRDFPLARINDSPHPRQGTKYRVWPLMNLAVTTDDIETGMTHIIRGKDHRDNAERQKMIYDVFGKKYPWAAFTGMTNFVGMKFSTRQMRKDIEEGIYSGWDDPKLPTVASLKKRGYKPEAFWKMAEHIGLNEVDKTFDKKEFFRLLDSFNR
ncbi:MAG: glutamate--tRNA ligase family protein [Nanoarchaeota archaeon]